MIEVFFAQTADLCNRDIYNRVLFSLPENRQKIIESRPERRRISSLAAYGLLFAAGVCGDIKFTENGKPYIEGNPVHFSLSHTKGIAVCAVSDSPVGIDVEKIGNARLSVIKKFTEAEQKYISASENPEKAFFEVWTKKEAAVKTAGGRIFTALGTVCTIKSADKFKSFYYGDYVISLHSENIKNENSKMKQIFLAEEFRL